MAVGNIAKITAGPSREELFDSLRLGFTVRFTIQVDLGAETSGLTLEGEIRKVRVLDRSRNVWTVEFLAGWPKSSPEGWMFCGFDRSRFTGTFDASLRTGEVQHPPLEHIP